MPKSPREHDLERESRRAFEAALTGRAVVRVEIPDYAIDGVVEQKDAQGNLTGLRFYVQLKGTDEVDLGRALALTMDLEDRAYYRSLVLPVLMVRYHAPTMVLYTRWLHQYDPYYGRGGRKTFTFRWDPADAWSDQRPSGLFDDARVYTELQSSQLALPRRFHVVSDGAFGLTTMETVLALRATAERRGDLIEVVGGSVTGGAHWIAFSETELVANLTKATASTLHFDGPYDPGESGESLASDALVMAAIAFANIGQVDLAANLVSSFAAGCSLLESTDVGFALQSIFTQARRTHESLDLATALDGSGTAANERASLLFTLPAMARGRVLSDGEAAHFIRVMKRRIGRRVKVGDKAAAARERVNLANFHRSRNEARSAIRLYQRAGREDQAYLERAYYWSELAGVLWMDHRYREAAEGYRRALDLGAPPINEALWTDCLLFDGDFAKARIAFAAFNAEHPKLASEYRLKEIALDVIVGELGISKQRRDTEVALHAAAGCHEHPTASQALEISRQQLKRDALWPSAWFNSGIAYRELGDDGKALKAFIAGMILMPGFDLEPGNHAFVLALMQREEQLAIDILTTAWRLAGPPLMTSLVEFARRQDPTFPREELLVAVDQILAEHAPRHAQEFTLRSIKADGTVQEIKITDRQTVGPPDRTAASA